MKNKFIIIISVFLVFILAPLMKVGYIFSLDQVLNPNGWLPKIWSNIFWLWYLSQIFVFFHIPIWIMEKIIILITFILPIIWWYLLLKNTKNIYTLLFSCLLLLFNPFLYWRFIDWQINIYLSYALFPLFFYFLKETLENTNIKNIMIISFYSLFLCFTSLHNVIFLFFIFLIFFIFYFKKTWLKNIIKIWLSVFIINLSWFIPIFVVKDTERFWLINQIDYFWEEHRKVFATDSWNIGLFFNTLSMNGYWWEREKRFNSVSEYNKIWYILFLIIFCLSIYWVFKKYNKQKLNNFDKSLILLFLISFIFSFWISNNNIFSGINSFMYDYFPMYKGMREPHKWIIFLVIFYSYFWWYWLYYIIWKINKSSLLSYNKILFSIILCSLPIFYSSWALFGFKWQVSIVNYPKDWKEIKSEYKKIFISKNNCKYLKEKKSNKCYNVLVFPWHSYINITFTKKNIGSWIVNYFWDWILFWDNIEIWDIYTQSTRLESKIIEKYIWPKWDFNNTITEEKLKKFYLDLNWLWIWYILFLKESDYKKYEEIFNFSIKKWFIKVEKENNMLIFYKILL